MIVDNNPSERKDNPIPWTTIPWREIRDRLEIRSSDGLFCMSAREFVRQGKVNPLSKEFKRAFNILIYLCKAGPHYQAMVARRILEKAGYKKGIIPKEAYVKNRTDDDFLRMYQVNPATLIRQIHDIKKNIKSFFERNHQKRRIAEDAIKEVFGFAFDMRWHTSGRDMTIEEIEALREELGKKGIGKIAELALFFEACRSGLHYKTLRKLYYSRETRLARKELEALGDIYAVTSTDGRWLAWRRHAGFIGETVWVNDLTNLCPHCGKKDCQA